MSKDKYLPIALLVVIAIFFVLVASLTSDIHRLRKNGQFQYPSTTHSIIHLTRRPATLADVSLLADWMTFSYINKSFSLPTDYLQTTLGIASTTYPNITITKIAKAQGITVSIYLQTVKNAVSAYLEQNNAQ